MFARLLTFVSTKPESFNCVTTLLVELTMLFKLPAALAILVTSPLLMALTKLIPAAAVLTSELPAISPAVLIAPTRLPLFKLSTTLSVLPASAKEIPSAIMVVDASLPRLGSDINAPTMPIASPFSKALTTFSPVETSDMPDTPASDAMPPRTSPRSIAIAALMA